MTPDLPDRGSFLRLAEKAFGLIRQFLQSAARIIYLPQADKFHTCSLRSMFCQVHAPTEHDFDFDLPLPRQTLRGFFDRLRNDPRSSGSGVISQSWDQSLGNLAFAGSAGLCVIVGISSDAFLFLQLALRLTFMKNGR